MGTLVHPQPTKSETWAGAQHSGCTSPPIGSHTCWSLKLFIWDSLWANQIRWPPQITSLNGFTYYTKPWQNNFRIVKGHPPPLRAMKWAHQPWGATQLYSSGTMCKLQCLISFSFLIRIILHTEYLKMYSFKGRSLLYSFIFLSVNDLLML